MIFNKSIKLCNHQHNLNLELSHRTPKIFHKPICSQSPLTHPSPKIHWSTFCLYKCSLLYISYKWNRTVCILVDLACFTYRNVFEVHPCFSMYHCLISFDCWILFHCMAVPHFICPFIRLIDTWIVSSLWLLW